MESIIEEKRIVDLCETYGQGHLVDHLMRLSGESRSTFLRNIAKIDFTLLYSLYSDLKARKKTLIDPSEIEPPEVIPYPASEEEKKRQEKAKTIGEHLLREGKIACLLVAGGQATRMGIPYPKGLLPITPVKKKTFFQLFCEKILALSIRYRSEIPLFIMTNPESREEIQDFFERQAFFGLKKENVIIFEQSTLPLLTKDGKIIIRNETQVLLGPTGHGDSIGRIYELGVLDSLIERGYKHIFYFQVDNPLVKVADPVFLGYHMMYGADMSLKVVRKKSEEEKVGLYVNISGKPAVIEYSDLDPQISGSRDEKGDLIYWAGNTAMHVFSLDFLRRINSAGISLPFHLAEKKVYVEKENREIDSLKFERFVFDCLMWTEKVCAMEIIREEEFSPVKNMAGASSPVTAKKDMSNLFKKWLNLCGIDVPEEVDVEISPLFALDSDECLQKLSGKSLAIKKDTYIA